MSLYHHIIEYEISTISEALKLISEQSPMGKRIIQTIGDIVINDLIRKKQVLLDTAYRLGESKLNDYGLEQVIQSFERIEADLMGQPMGISIEMRNFKKEWCLANIEFYKQIISQEGKASNYAEAVKSQFKDASEYLSAQNTITQVEEKITSHLEENYPPKGAEFSRVILQTMNNIRESHAEMLFAE